jgi:cell division protein ZipA
MELSIRDWMVIIGGLLILAVLLDGYRRMRGGNNRVKLSITPVPEGDGPDAEISMLRELPNGGARVVGRTGGSGEYPEDDSQENTPAVAEPQTGDTLDLLEGLAAERETEQTSAGNFTEAEEVIMMHVAAREDAGFAGEDILHILLTCDMRFGEMDFFHRHSKTAGKGTILFSVANMVQPGIFDIDDMAGFSTPGLTFFMTCPGPPDMMKAFDLMRETAECVADNLGGDLLDDTRSVATKQTLDHIRQRIRDLERRLLTQAAR